MNRLLTTIPGARGRGPVRVERKIRRRSADEVRGAGVTAVEDALFRMGGPRTGRDVLRILAAGKPDRPNGKPKPAQVITWAAETSTEQAPVSSPGIALTGALAADVCRHIWAERGRSAPILYSGGL